MWQPIETVPESIKDVGAPILVWKPDERRVGEYMLAAYWGEWPDMGWGWVACSGTRLGYFSKWENAPQGYPTHWMPLPDPPIEGAGRNV